jgi:hypothetical protein
VSGPGLGLLLACLLPGCAQPPVQLEAEQSVVVKFLPGLEVSAQDTRFDVQAGPRSRMDAASVAAALDALDATLRSAGVREIQRVFEAAEPPADGDRDLDLDLYYQIRVLEAADAQRLTQGLRVNPLVQESRLHPLGVPIPRPGEDPQASP